MARFPSHHYRGAWRHEAAVLPDEPMASLWRRSGQFCCRCALLAARKDHHLASYGLRFIRHPAKELFRGDESTKPHDGKRADTERKAVSSRPAVVRPEKGPMTRRLEEATEEALLEGGASGRRAIDDAGFSDELKKSLMEKIAAAKVDGQVVGDSADGIPAGAGQGTRGIAKARPWTGQEAVEDTVLRMLDDSKGRLDPRLRGKFEPPVVDTRLRRKVVVSPGQRAANARDKAALYAGIGIKDGSKKGLSEEEKKELQRDLRERFQPGAASLPVSVSGLAAVANQRIEEAIARGQFKDLPRGRELAREAGASNPFIDTTEFLMNRLVQRQEVVPPWIEKQQELARATSVFRQRLRNDWRRHASRMMAARGGSLGEQMERAERYAAAERIHNRKGVSTERTKDGIVAGHGNTNAAEAESGSGDEEPARSASGPPFRDDEWERAEEKYLKLSVEKLNSLARSYNLMAPELAKKPYFSLRRELDACYADVAPQVAGAIREGATASRPRAQDARGRDGGGAALMGLLGGKDGARPHLEASSKVYGLREWWREFWKR